MVPSSVFAGVFAAAAFTVGTVGMAQPSSYPQPGGHESMPSMAQPVAGSAVAAPVLTESRQAQILARGSLPRIRGKVTSAPQLTVSKTSVPAGRYKFVVRDETSSHNWHITGPSVDKKTTVSGTGRVVWRLRLAQGTFEIVCDIHPGTMHKTLTVN